MNRNDQTNEYIKQLEALTNREAVANNKYHSDKVNREIKYIMKKPTQMNQFEPFIILCILVVSLITHFIINASIYMYMNYFNWHLFSF